MTLHKHPLQPKLWPPNVRYITRNIKSLDEPVDPTEHVPLLRNRVEIRKVPKGHPAYSDSFDKGFGLYAIKDIRKGTIIGEYTGVTKKRAGTPYGLEKCNGLCIDAWHAGNEVFISIKIITHLNR